LTQKRCPEGGYESKRDRGARSARGGITACDRCTAEPDADLIRYVAYEPDEEVLGFVLCPKCSYGFNTLMRAYLANLELSIAS